MGWIHRAKLIQVENFHCNHLHCLFCIQYILFFPHDNPLLIINFSWILIINRWRILTQFIKQIQHEKVGRQHENGVCEYGMYIRGFTKFGIKVLWRLQFLEYLWTLRLKFQKACKLRQPTGQTQDNFNYGPSLLKF